MHFLIMLMLGLNLALDWLITCGRDKDVIPRPPAGKEQRRVASWLWSASNFCQTEHHHPGWEEETQIV